MLDLAFSINDESSSMRIEKNGLSHELNSLTAVSLFSGCGGLDLGAEMSGVNIIYSIDSMGIAAKTLKNNFSNADCVHGKIEEVTNFPNAELLLGGYPCQSFSMGGRRAPETDQRSNLYMDYARTLDAINPKYFIAENVAGLKSLNNGKHLKQHLKTFADAGTHGYYISWAILDAADYGVPQKRRRLFIVGVRKDFKMRFKFPIPSHGPGLNRKRYTSHGEAIDDLPLWPEGEFYERPNDPDGSFSWYYMSRNRKAIWSEPSYTIVANWRHTTLHPSSPTMKLVWSDLKNGFKQGWEFTDEYEHIVDNFNRRILDIPRRLSWRECARIQTFPDSFKISGTTAQKIQQIGNAVPPMLAKAVISHLVSGAGLVCV